MNQCADVFQTCFSRVPVVFNDLVLSDGMKRPKSLDVITHSKGHVDSRRLSFQTKLPFDDVKGYVIDGDSEDEDFLEAPRKVLASEHEAKGDVLINTASKYKDRLRELEDENEKLKEQISEVTRVNDLNLTRLQCLEQQLQEQEKKEREETAALEKMVQGVEKNLQRAMERATSAEALSTSLKQELKVLQASYKQLEHERDMLKENSVSTTATDVATKLWLAADSAEAQLKSLMEGVGHLRLYSDVLSSISRVQEEPS
ncbi:uncharacterized protein LOC135378456 isoform X2 [Ornithodoros turicata]|uniref:uncharacterized protein LOC135378456 isoform X2 n=1 Tax=Ornithodoros turicata TaxID=34597 RepID=UPI0031394A5B